MSFFGKQLRYFSIVSSFFLMSVTALADDGLTPGPGLFSGERGEFSLTAMLDKSISRQQGARAAQDDSIDIRDLASVENNIDSNVKLKQPVADFKTYQEWRKLHNADPELYADFQLYLDYKAFLELKR